MDAAARTPSRSEVSGNGAARETAVLTFQEAIARLQSYWASVGCAVWQPFNSEVHSPATHMCLQGVGTVCGYMPSADRLH